MTSSTTTSFDINVALGPSGASYNYALAPGPGPGQDHELEISRWATIIWSRNSNVDLPTIPLFDLFFDIGTIALILCFLCLSLVSLSFVLHLRIKSRNSSKLRSFSAHWTARFLMIILVSLWAINEFLRLPLFRKSFLFPFLPPVAVPQQAQFCKSHLILSFGLYEPGFLVCLLFLVNLSINKRSPNNLWAIGFVAITCLPLVIAFYFTVNVLPKKFTSLPPVFYRSSVVLRHQGSGTQVVYCTYPLLGGLIFTAFGGCYTLVFLVSSCKVMSLAINKRLRTRVNTLAYSVLLCITAQIVIMSISVFWGPGNAWYYVLVLVNFVSVLICGAVGEGVLVIKPVLDALSVGSGDMTDESV